eukprot:m.192620 g.192620  ORF g.192620 m.192620 type:complete len:52 (-) comp32475_c2_seq6:161-316(-)
MIVMAVSHTQTGGKFNMVNPENLSTCMCMVCVCGRQLIGFLHIIVAIVYVV